jgi:hypothetical protein
MCGLLGGCFHVLVLCFYLRGILGGRPKTYPPCIMDSYVLGASYRGEALCFLIYIEGVLSHCKS